MANLMHEVVLFVSLLLLEAVLSADNAVALASLVRDVEPPERRQRLLQQGLLMALGLRAVMVAAAGVLLEHPLVRLLGGGYLIWLAVVHFQEQLQSDASLAPVHHPSHGSGMSLVMLVGLTDLAFSLDSVSTAVAVTDRWPLVILAGSMGILLLRFLAGWMLNLMGRFPNLQNAGYLTVLVVGLRLTAEEIAPPLVPSEPILLAVVVLLFGWGLSGARLSEG